jgi:hypothetical protein
MRARQLKTLRPATSGGGLCDESINQIRFVPTIWNGNCYLIGFDGSAFAAKPAMFLERARLNKFQNRVNVRFMTKVFRSIPSKFRKWQERAKLNRKPYRIKILLNAASGA